jgi:hypothetical protein
MPRRLAWTSIIRPCALILVLVPSHHAATAATWFVQAGAGGGGDGTRDRPFGDLQAVEASSAPGDHIFVLPSEGVLDGGIQLKDDQRLIGLGPAVTQARAGEPRAAITNTAAARLSGDAVRLASGNTVANLHIARPFRSGIFGINALSPHLRNNLITEHLIQGDNLVLLESAFRIGGSAHYGAITLVYCGTGAVSITPACPPGGGIAATGRVRISGTVIRDGNLQGISVICERGVQADLSLDDNSVEDLSQGLGRPEDFALPTVRTEGVGIRALNGSQIALEMNDTFVANIAPNGNYAVDEVFFVNAGQGSAVRGSISGVVVHSNPTLVGTNVSEPVNLIYNVDSRDGEYDLTIRGVEIAHAVSNAIIIAEFPPAIGNRTRLLLEDMVIYNDNPLHALGGIGYSHTAGASSGSGSRLDLTVRNTRIFGSRGGGVRLFTRSVMDELRVRFEDTSLADLTHAADGVGLFAMFEKAIPGAVIDLGGGTLGSAGRNRFVGNGSHNLVLTNLSAVRVTVHANDDYWGGGAPAKIVTSGAVTVDATTYLTSDPSP